MMLQVWSQRYLHKNVYTRNNQGLHRKEKHTT